VPLESAPWRDISVPGHAAQVEASDLLRALRDRVDPDDWRAWIAHALDGETTAEIVARTHEPTSVIEARFSRVHATLDRLLRPFGVQRKIRRRKGDA
jgi:DNA-directed RNA polymerase specialized sigma24 family protein